MANVTYSFPTCGSTWSTDYAVYLGPKLGITSDVLDIVALLNVTLTQANTDNYLV